MLRTKLNRSDPHTSTNHDSSDFLQIGGSRIYVDEITNTDVLTPDRAKSFRQIFLNAKPFPHVVFEGLFSSKLLECIYSEFDILKYFDWVRYDNRNERKLGTGSEVNFGPATQLYFATIHCRPFVDFLTKVSGINGLIPDPMLVGGGLHEIPPGGKFAVHTDFTNHPITKLSNRLVFITYLNKEWKVSYGGSLELWDTENGGNKAEIVPLFGRSILFLQSPKSLHGHPRSVNAPHGRPRRSALAYYYSNGGVENFEPASTSFPKPLAVNRPERVALMVKAFTPPILIDAIRAMIAKVTNLP